MTTIKNRIVSAIDALKAVDLPYWEATLAQRLPGGAGSVVEEFHTIEELEAALKAASWEPFVHPAIAGGCEAYVTSDISGHMGVVPLATLPGDTVVTLDDRKDTGKVSATVRGVVGDRVDYTVIILGNEEGKTIVFTFHPGDPVTPSKVEATKGLHGKEVTVSEALKMGLTTAKIVA